MWRQGISDNYMSKGGQDIYAVRQSAYAKGPYCRPIFWALCFVLSPFGEKTRSPVSRPYPLLPAASGTTVGFKEGGGEGAG